MPALGGGVFAFSAAPGMQALGHALPTPAKKGFRKR
jgi:hypothetical protein